MKRKILLTLSGVCLSVALALGGWLLVGWLLASKERALLSGWDWPAVSESGGEEIVFKPGMSALDAHTYPIPDRPGLKEEEIVPIISSWEEDSAVVPYKPLSGEILLEEAVAIGESWLVILRDQMGIPGIPYPYESLNAYLGRREIKSKVTDVLFPYYGFWCVTFYSGSGRVWMYINAMTGAVWNIGIVSDTSRDFTPWCTREVLEVYVDASALTVDTVSYATRADSIFCKTDNHAIYVIVNAFYANSQGVPVTALNIGLSTDLMGEYYVHKEAVWGRG